MLEKLWQNDIPVLRDFSWLNDVCTTNKSHKQSDRKPIERRTKKVYCEFLFSQTNWQSCACCISNSVITSQCKAISIEREKKEKKKNAKKKMFARNLMWVYYFCVIQCIDNQTKKRKSNRWFCTRYKRMQNFLSSSFFIVISFYYFVFHCVSYVIEDERGEIILTVFFFGKSKSIISLASMRK